MLQAGVCARTHAQTTLPEMQTFPGKIQQGLTGPASWSYKGRQVLSTGWRQVLFPQLHSQGNALQAQHREPVWLGSEACQHIQEVKSERGPISNRASCTRMPRQRHALPRQEAYQPGSPWVLSKKPLRMARGHERKKQSLAPRDGLWLPEQSSPAGLRQAHLSQSRVLGSRMTTAGLPELAGLRGSCLSPWRPELKFWKGNEGEGEESKTNRLRVLEREERKMNGVWQYAGPWEGTHNHSPAMSQEQYGDWVLHEP